MGTLPGLYRIQAHLQFTHYAEGISTVLGYLAFTDKRIGAEEPVLHSNVVELQVLPPAGGNIEVEVVLQDQVGQTQLSGISARLFATADMNQNNWSLADAWQLGTPILSGVTGTEGTAIWNEGICLNAGDYTAIAAYHDAYQSAVYQTNDGDWGPGCEQTVVRQIVFETALAPVEDLYARAKSGKINLVWSCPADAVSYDVYRSTTQGGPYQLIQEGHETMYCAFADFGLTNDITYYYVVQWRNAGGVLSPDSNEANATPTDRRQRR
jgi:hypothetical protein